MGEGGGEPEAGEAEWREPRAGRRETLRSERYAERDLDPSWWWKPGTVRK